MFVKRRHISKADGMFGTPKSQRRQACAFRSYSAKAPPPFLILFFNFLIFIYFYIENK